MSHAVDIQHLTHRYGDLVAVHDLSLQVEAGTLFGLLGPNGGGKTTLFRILSTLLPPSEGQARVFGHDTVAEPEAARRRLGMVFQHAALDDELTVVENLRFHGALYGLRGTALTQRIDQLLATFGLTDRAGDRTKTLSGGLQRRVDLARGLLHTPDLLLLDEPTTGLDPGARHSFWQTLDRLRRTEGTTLVVATHLMDEAVACDRVGILDRGRLVAAGEPAALCAALGDETLWLETDAPADLADRLEAQFNLSVHRAGDALQVAHPDAPRLLHQLYDAFGDRIRSATVRKPTLEDVFLHHTGYALADAREMQNGK